MPGGMVRWVIHLLCKPEFNPPPHTHTHRKQTKRHNGSCALNPNTGEMVTDWLAAGLANLLVQWEAEQKTRRTNEKPSG